MSTKILKHPNAHPPDLNTVREWLAIICEIEDENVRWLYRTDRIKFIEHSIQMLISQLSRTKAGYPYGN